MSTGDESHDHCLRAADVSELLDGLAADSEERLDRALEALPVQAHELASLDSRVRSVRALLSRWKRRGQELSALFSSARELAELRDSDALLHGLVERAHQLMGMDVTYLSEFYEGSDELRVRSTAGAVAETFRELRVPPGMGLASQVVRRRCAQWTSAYQVNDEIPHEDGIDAAVADEGLVSLLGVPLAAGDRVLGVLFAANRNEHDFTPEEIALLSAFADHAAVVVQTTALLERARFAAEQAEHAKAVLESNVTAMERASAVHEDLTAVVLRGGRVDGVADTLSTALRRPVMILDRDQTLAAQAPRSTAMHALDSTGLPVPSVRAAVEQSLLSGRCVFVDGAAPLPEVAVAVVASGTSLGAIVVGNGDVDLGEVEQRTIERASQIAALVAVQQEAIAAAEERVRGELVSDILNADKTRWQELVLRARARDVRLDELRSVVAVVTSADNRRALSALLRRVAPSGLVAEHDGAMVVLAASSEPFAMARDIVETARRVMEADILAVAGPQARSADLLGQSYETARRCVSLLGRLGIADGAMDAQAYAPYMAMFGANDEHPTTFIEATIGPVLRWDRRRGTDLFGTLRAFIDSHASPTRTARALHVHINTVTQRLERIDLLLGTTWREPEPMFRLAVAVRLHALATSGIPASRASGKE